ncbi:ATP-binding protein [Olleya sp. Bg11-27]|uniref:ATP-binding protein n=1 Tax=Olleya sp. Bg11-27 TaxID=2058135 RepID=UPI000C30EF6E|nr:ATP-binding protein [Olleya sp. Bg11-27]AUC76412.1 ATP-binding protein [Olleya sp. Bg11-27]
MNLQQLKEKTELIISDLKNNGRFPKENNGIDYKLKLNIAKTKNPLENFLLNFTKDILSFSNSDGGILLLGINEDSVTGTHTETGLDKENLDLLNQIDLNDITQKFEKIVKLGISIDLQIFQIGTKKFYYLIIEKSNQVLIPINDFLEFKITKGSIYYRASSKNEHANKSTTDFNRFLQIKANEKSKEFMEIWSKLLPEMVDINPREVLILNPAEHKIYGFNSKDKILSGSDIEIDETQNSVFNIILNAISAGDIGKITTNEGKPIYKIVGEIQNTREHIMLSNLTKEVQRLSKYKFSSEQLKQVMFYFNWVSNPKFKAVNPTKGNIKTEFDKYIWIETTDKISKRTKVYFSDDAIVELLKAVDNSELHIEIFGKSLSLKASA